MTLAPSRAVVQRSPYATPGGRGSAHEGTDNAEVQRLREHAHKDIGETRCAILPNLRDLAHTNVRERRLSILQGSAVHASRIPYPQSGAHTEAMINMMSVHYSRGDISVHFHPSVRIEDAARLRLLISAWAVGVPHEGGTDDGD